MMRIDRECSSKRFESTFPQCRQGSRDSHDLIKGIVVRCDAHKIGRFMWIVKIVARFEAQSSQQSESIAKPSMRVGILWILVDSLNKFANGNANKTNSLHVIVKLGALEKSPGRIFGGNSEEPIRV